MCIRVNQCCCGCTLQTGTKIIGWLTLLGELLNIGQYTIMLIMLPLVGIQAFVSGSYVIWITFMVCSPIMIAFTILLLISSTKNSRPRLLLPFLIFNIITILTLIGFGIYCLFIFIMYEYMVASLGFIAQIIFRSGIGIYYWVVIFSYYKQLKEMETSKKNTTNRTFESHNI